MLILAGVCVCVGVCVGGREGGREEREREFTYACHPRKIACVGARLLETCHGLVKATSPC